VNDDIAFADALEFGRLHSDVSSALSSVLRILAVMPRANGFGSSIRGASPELTTCVGHPLNSQLIAAEQGNQG
jgi:hypothetical protein